MRNEEETLCRLEIMKQQKHKSTTKQHPIKCLLVNKKKNVLLCK